MSVDEDIEDVDVEHNVDDVQAEIEEVAVGVLLVTRNLGLVVDVLTHIPHNILTLRLCLPETISFDVSSIIEVSLLVCCCYCSRYRGHFVIFKVIPDGVRKYEK